MGVLPAASRRSRLFGHNRTHPLQQSPSRRGVSLSSPTSTRGGKFSWRGLTLATETLKTFGGDRPAVEQWFLRLHYRRLPHVHLLVADGVQYGARGFVGREGVELSQRRSTTEHVRCGSRCRSRCGRRCGSRCSCRCWCNASRAAPQEVSKGKVRYFFFFWILPAPIENGRNQGSRHIYKHLFCGSYRCCDCLR